MSWDDVPLKGIRWAGRSREDLAEMPKPVRGFFGVKLEALQHGEHLRPPAAKMLAHYEPTVIELVKDFNKDTYRAMVTVQLEDAIYVLHVFKKKSTHGIGMTKQDQDLIAQRLREAIQDHEEMRRRQRQQGGHHGL